MNSISTRGLAFSGWPENWSPHSIFSGTIACRSFSFQFFTRLTTVFAEELDSFGVVLLDGPIEWCLR